MGVWCALVRGGTQCLVRVVMWLHAGSVLVGSRNASSAN